MQCIEPFAKITQESVDHAQSLVVGPLSEALSARAPNLVSELSTFMRDLNKHLYPTSSGIAPLMEGRRGGKQFKAVNILHLMFCACGLKRYDSLVRHVWLSLRAVVPQMLGDNLDVSKLEAAMPGKTTLFR